MDGLVDALKNLSLPPNAGIGIDLVRVSRFEKLQREERFLDRIFSADEITHLGKGVQRMASLAVRWAAKEACAKALGCGIGSELTWREMEIFKDGKGKPHLRLLPDAAKRHNNPELCLSMSHDADYAIAIVWIPPRTSDHSTGIENDG